MRAILILPMAACAGEGNHSSGSSPTGRLGSTGQIPGAEDPELSAVELVRVGVVELEEPDSALITGIETLAVDRLGRLAIPDQIEKQVRVYGPRGELLRNLGKEGEGPGEFMHPWRVAFTVDGSLYVGEGGHPRITRFTRELALDTVFPIWEAFMTVGLAGSGNELLVGHHRAPSERHRDFVGRYDATGERTETFHQTNELIFNVPYWWSVLSQLPLGGYVLAASPSRVVVGSALTYPLAMYTPDGTFLGTVGAPPASWKQAPRLEAGEWAVPDQVKRVADFLRRITTIHQSGFYRDSLLVVSHRHLDPHERDYEEAAYTLDVYDRLGRKLVADLSLRGPVVGVGEHLFLLETSAPSPWTLGRYEIRALREPESDRSSPNPGHLRPRALSDVTGRRARDRTL